jgi:hypothetical protein
LIPNLVAAYEPAVSTAGTAGTTAAEHVASLERVDIDGDEVRATWGCASSYFDKPRTQVSACQHTNANRPSPRSYAAMVANARYGSSKNVTPNGLIATSKEESKPCVWTSAYTNSTIRARVAL